MLDTNHPEKKPATETAAAAFLLCLSNSKNNQNGANGKKEKRKIRFALSNCTLIPGRFLACVPAVGKKPIQLHMSPDGLVHYGGETFDTIAIEAMTSLKEAESKAKSLVQTKAAPTDQMLREAAYLQFEGSYCFYCRQDQIEGEFVEVGGGKAWQRINCLCCGRHWHDVYTLTGVTEA